MKNSTAHFLNVDIFKVTEEPEEYVVEEKLHFISKRVEAETIEGISALELILTLCVFGLCHSICSYSGFLICIVNVDKCYV